MTETLTKTEAVGRLIELAKEMEVTDPIDWSKVNVTEDQIYEMMAGSVLDQMYSVPLEHRETVSMATLTKLLGENFTLKFNLEEEKKKHALSANSR